MIFSIIINDLEVDRYNGSLKALTNLMEACVFHIFKLCLNIKSVANNYLLFKAKEK